VPVAIFVHNAGPFSGGRRAILDAEPKARELAIFGYELEMAGLGAAVENMWLAAVAQGVSAVFMGDVSLAGLPDQPFLFGTGDLLGALALGYVKEGLRQQAVPDTSRQQHVRWI